MNEHELERIAAAANALRPDWPTASLKTLLRSPQLANRPRRDVAVALAWIACEANTATPKRVLENGPWWRAVMVEAGPTGPVKRGPLCVHCGFEEHECKRRWNDHDYEGPDDWMRRRPNTNADDMRNLVSELRDRIEPTVARPGPRPKPTKTDPNIQAARDAIAPEPTEETTDA